MTLPTPSRHIAVIRPSAWSWRLRFVSLAVIWGLSFLLIKLGNESFAPLQVSLGRMALGTVTLLGVLAAKRERLPSGWRIWGHLTVAALLLNVVPFTLFAYAEQRIPSALAGIYNATAPLFAVAAALAILPGERPTRRRNLGLALGFVGVTVVLGAWRGFAHQDLAGTLMALSATACYGIGWPYLRRYLTDSGCSNTALSGGMLLAGTLQLAIITPLFSAAPTHVSLRSALAMLALGCLGTGVAYILQYGLIHDAGATIASTVTYLIPLIATIVGVALLGESLSWNQPVGALIILAAAALSQN